MSKFVKKILAVAAITAVMAPSYVAAQSAPVVCKDYKRGTTSIPSERTGKKIQKALEAYNNDMIPESLELLYDINPKAKFDKAFTERFIGNILAGQEGQGKKALGHLRGVVQEKTLNDSEHANTLRLVGDLSMQEKEYNQAISYYEKWMKFTCKQDPDIYTRIAQAYYETRQLAKMVDPADKAIALYEKPNKNPYVLKLTSYYERKMYPQTVKVAEVLVKTFPDNKQWWSQLGFFYMLVEDYKKALSTFEMAYNKGMLEKKSEIKALAQLYATNDIPYKAARVYEKHIKSGLLDRDAKALATLANSFHQAKEYKEAAMFYGQAGAMSNDADHFRRQGILLHASEDYKGALKALQTALDKGAQNKGRIHIAMMEAHLYTGNFKQALVHAKEAKKDKQTRRNANAWEPYIREKASNRGIKI